MPKRTHSRNVAARRLRATVASEKAWMMNPPQLQALLDLVEVSHQPNALNDVRSQFGIHAEDPTRIQRVGNIAVIPITGTIRPKSDFITRYFGGTSLELLERDFRNAMADSQVKSIVFLVDSYGGSAEQNEEISKLIYSSRGKKSMRAFVRGGCCSAAYYLASAADSIDASPSSMIGSVGCIAVHEEYAQALEDYGIGATVITYGSKKGHGNVYEKLSTDAKATLQKMVNDYGELFTAAVARNRGVSAEIVNQKFGQGSAFLAAEALERGLIDRVGTWEQVLAELGSDSPPVPVESKTESATAAGASAATQSDLPPVTPAGQEVSSVDPRIKAMLFARGLISSIDANDEECKVALRSYFAGRGETQPTDTNAIVNSLMAAQPPPAPQAQPAANVPAATGATGAPASTGGMQPTQPDLVAAERQRVLDLQAAAPDFGIEGEALATAINSGQSYEAVVAGWQRARVQTHRPVAGQVNVGQSGAERFMIDASNALALRAGCNVPAAARNAHVERLQRAPLLHFAEQCLQHSGTRIPEGLEPVERAELALAETHTNRTNIGVSADAGAYNRPGDFPGLLSNLANTMLLEGIERADAPWDQWTGRVADDLADFHPAPMVRKGEAEELDEVLDDEAFKELKISEELNSYLQLGRYGNHIKLTPVMVAQDKLGAFRESLWGLGGAHETKLNRLCLSILTGNVTLLDTYALFDDTNHGNDLSAGAGSPSDSQWEAMELKYWAQRVIGSATSPYQGGRLALALVPPKWARAATQTFATLSDLLETKQPVTDTTINTYRGKVRYVVDAELQRSSACKWYGMADPSMRPTIKVAFFRGWGRNGKRERWYDPARKCQCFSLEGRFGAAAADYRTAVRNAGQ